VARGGRAQAERWPPVTYWMKAAAGVLVILALARIVIEIQNVLILIVIALVLAIGFQPAVAWLERFGLRRGWAVATIFLAGVLVIGVFLALILPVIIREVGGLVRDAPEYIRRAQQESELFQRLNQQFDLSERLASLGKELPTTALSLIRSFTAFLFNSLTVLILTLFFMSAMPRLRHGVAALLRVEHRDEFESILEESTQRVGGYVMGNLTVSLIAGVTSFVALLIIGVPYAAALAFWVALADLIPSVGATLGAIPAVLVAAFAGLPEFIATLIFFVVYQQIENYLVAPRVMRRAIDVSVATVIVAVLIGGSLAGFVGALLALPMAAIIKAAVRELYLEDRMEEVSGTERYGH
jgi:predicted PurR-regulated permease PerM